MTRPGVIPPRGRFLVRAAITIALACGAASLAAQSWPSFRGPGAAGFADGLDLPLRWNIPAGEGLAWKTTIPGLGHSSPIVWGERVFVTTAISSLAETQFRTGFSTSGEPSSDTSPHEWRIYALDLATGEVRWQRTILKGVPRTLRHMKSSHASATPATDGRVVVAFLGSEGLHAFAVEDGKPLWSRDLGVLDAGSIYYPERQWGMASSPIIAGDFVIVQCDQQKDSFIAAFDLATGKERWRQARQEIPSWASPTLLTVGGRRLVVTNAAKYARAYDLETGAEVWRLANTSEIAVPTPVEGDGLVVLMSGYQPQKPIFAVKVSASGDISLAPETSANQNVVWSKTRGGAYITTPLLYRGLLYTTSSNGVLTCYELATGKQLYERRLADKGGAYSASPVASDGRVYLASEDGEVHVIAAGPEYELLATNEVGETLMATPALASRRLIVRGRHHVFALGPR